MNVTQAEPSTATTAASPPVLIPPGRGKAEGDAGPPQATEGRGQGEDEVAAGLAADKSKGSLPRQQKTRALDIQEAIRKANEALAAFDATGLKLLYDRQRDLVIFQVLKPADKPWEKDKVIRQIPAEDLLRLADRLNNKLEELQGVGMLFDQQV